VTFTVSESNEDASSVNRSSSRAGVGLVENSLPSSSASHSDTAGPAAMSALSGYSDHNVATPAGQGHLSDSGSSGSSRDGQICSSRTTEDAAIRLSSSKTGNDFTQSAALRFIP
jgi:hypothetical protein